MSKLLCIVCYFLLISADPEDVLQIVDEGINAKDQDAKRRCEKLAFSLIQSLFVTCIGGVIQEMAKRGCYGCNNWHGSQIQHDKCTMMNLEEQCDLYFEEALEEVLDSKIETCRMNWMIIAIDNPKV